jgi:LacI family transcriptional regulator
MLPDIHILLVADRYDTGAMTAVVRHVERHGLPWQLHACDAAHAARMGHHLRPAGLIGWVRPSELDWWCETPVPAVVFGGPPQPGVTRLVYDDAAAGRLAARHFLAMGLGAVATVRPWQDRVRAPRYAAFHAEAARLGLRTLVHEPEPVGCIPAMEAALAAWLRSAPHPLGVFLHQDHDALDLMWLCQRHGIRVPDEVAMLGVDDLPACTATRPALTSIASPRAALAASMALELHRQLGGAPTPDGALAVLPLRVIARASTALSRSGDAAMDRVRRAVAAGPGRRFTTADLARLAGISPGHLFRRFRRAWGTTPRVWQNRCRLALAQELLLTRDLDVDAVARRCGLATGRGLWRLFREADLPPPARWRGLMRGDRPHG